MNGLVIAMPTRNTPGREAWYAMLTAAQKAGGATMQWPPGAPRDHNRNKIVQMFLDDPKAEWLLFIDDDTTVPADCVEKLMSVGKPCVVGVQPLFLNGILVASVSRDLASKTVKAEWRSWFGVIEDEKEPFQVKSCGFGCVLTHRSVWEKIKHPWFVEDYGDVYGDKSITEDIFFCNRCNDEGIEIWCNPAVQCGHIKNVDMREWAPLSMIDLKPKEEAA